MSSYNQPPAEEPSVSESKPEAQGDFVVDDYFSHHVNQFDNFQVWNPGDESSTQINEVGSPNTPSFVPNTNEQAGQKSALDESSQILEDEYEKGFEAGKAAAREELESQSEQLDALLGALNEGHCNIQEFYMPLKKLAVRIAKAVLKVDLEESEKSIEKIAEELLSPLSKIKDEPVRLFLSPEDFKKVSVDFRKKHSNVEFMEDRKLSRGSSYAEMNDRLVTDFLEERLANVVQQVIQNDLD